MPSATPSIGVSGNYPGAQFSLPGYQQPVVNPVNQLPQVMPAVQPMPVASTPVALPAPIVNPAPVPAAASVALNPLAALGQIQLDTSNPTTLALQIQLVKALSEGKIPTDQMPQVLAALGVAFPNTQNTVLPTVQLPTQATSTFVLPQNGNQHDTHGVQAPQNDRLGGQPPSSNELNRQKRQRSRSPDQKRRRTSPPNRRKSPVYAAYDPVTVVVGEPNPPPQPERVEPERRGGKKGKGGNKQEAQGRPRSSPPQQSIPKLIGFDPTLPPNNIRGLLFRFFLGRFY